MKKIILICGGLLAIIVAFQNCGQNMLNTMDPAGQDSLNFFGTSTGNPNNGDFPPVGKINFAEVSSQVFQPNCVSCHRGERAEKGIRFDAYESALETGELSILRQSYEAHQEPDSDCTPISKEDMNLVALWIQMGAPR